MSRQSSPRSRSGGTARWKCAQPEEQVVAELIGHHQRVEVPVGGRHDAHVGRARPGRAERLELAGLQRPQQHRLRGRVQIADFVEEDHAAVGFFERAPPIGDGAGEAAPGVAEQLADGEVAVLMLRTVHRDVGPALLRAEQIDRLREALPCRRRSRR